MYKYLAMLGLIVAFISANWVHPTITYAQEAPATSESSAAWSILPDGIFGLDPIPNADSASPAYRYRISYQIPGAASTHWNIQTVPLLDHEKKQVTNIQVFGNTPMIQWASPVEGSDPALTSIDVGFGGKPIVYEIKVEKHGKYQLILGVCEGHHQQPAQRILQFSIDGQKIRTLDTMRDGRNVPIYETFDVEDADGDGIIRLEVGTIQESIDRNSILNVLWLLPQEANKTISRESLLAGKVDGAIIHHNASTRSQNPLRVQMTLTVEAPKSHDLTIAPIFSIETNDSASVVRERPNRYTIGNDFQWTLEGLPMRLNSIVNHEIRFECDSMILPAGESKEFSMELTREIEGTDTN
ncbi:MAG: hypothetical protein PHE53_02370 [Thermoguttaceae bacterium]|nr:hypothetical protein [Thermoguttaceae bacterium]